MKQLKTLKAKIIYEGDDSPRKAFEKLFRALNGWKVRFALSLLSSLFEKNRFRIIVAFEDVTVRISLGFAGDSMDVFSNPPGFSESIDGASIVNKEE